ncbi:AAA family ATPase [uncultured Spirosoma sp.]|uniref:AAA family ATPase n=1 Tax=uncultured Spirosoma sp. TaxID=278208 RepID=UPI00258A3C16|nr:AAA family ATPase [uncultured Spirosoma sp.]
MAKLTVKNVGPIQEAELDVKKHTVFIGPQGTGKSTLAKLIAIGSDSKLGNPRKQNFNSLIKKYGLEQYIDIQNTHITFENSNFKFLYKGDLDLILTDIGQEIIESYRKRFASVNPEYNNILSLLDFQKTTVNNPENIFYGNNQVHSQNFYRQVLPFLTGPYSILIPTERHILSILDNSIWSLIDTDINLPQLITTFGREFEKARHRETKLSLPFLGITYSYENGNNLIYHTGIQFTDLSQSASGFQSTVPLVSVVEYQRQENARRFIIEEPELNLYPTAQKDLIYALIGGLNPDVSYQDAEWVFTTHSPYVLSSFNTLMLAYKVGNQSDELRAEVEKIIPSRCWINPDDFAAYYVDNGTVRSIVSEQTGMIAENELDDVSDDLADEQDKLFALRRSSSRA